MWGQNLHIFPILCGTFLPISLAITYSITIGLRRERPDFPAISSTGGQPPESCVFTMLFNIYSSIMGVTIYIRYRQLDEFFSTLPTGPRRTFRNIFNKFIFVIGVIAAFGTSLVGDFPATEVHEVGSFVGFLGGGFYMWCQTVTSLRTRLLNLQGCSWVMCIARLIISVIATVFFATTIIAGQQSNKMPKYHQHGWSVFSHVSEWGMAIMNCVFWLTFITEFRQFTMRPPVFIHKDSSTVSLLPETGEPSLPETGHI